MTERYIDSRELAEAMGVSLATIVRWTRAGAPSETWGLRLRRYRLSEVEAWARERSANADAAVPMAAHEVEP
jgi:phage terminase Nu1 subunit (DNA packaging protein)